MHEIGHVMGVGDLAEGIISEENLSELPAKLQFQIFDLAKMYNLDKIDISIVDDRFQAIVKEMVTRTSRWNSCEGSSMTR